MLAGGHLQPPRDDVVGEDTGPLGPGQVQAVESLPAREGWRQALQLIITDTQLRESALNTGQISDQQS